MTDYGYWAETHQEVTEEELYGRTDMYLESYGSFVILGQDFYAQDIYKELEPVGYRELMFNVHDSLMRDGEILTDDEMQDYISEAMIYWANEVVLPELPDELQEQIDNDSEQYAWAIGELESSGILEYTDNNVVEIHAHYTLEYVVKYVIDYINE